MAEVLPFPGPHDGQSCYSSSPLQHLSPSSSFLIGSPTYSPSLIATASFRANTISSGDSSPYLSRPNSYTNLSRTPSFHSTPASTISLDTKAEDDEENFLPSYGDSIVVKHQEYSSSDPTISPIANNSSESSSAFSYTESTPTNESLVISPRPRFVADDTAIRDEPQRQVDYLSHDWKEEDIWSSWKHIVSKRKIYGERSRLENASWRTWTKSMHHLKTVSPETLNWLKDCDVTWLYGPLQEPPRKPLGSEPLSYLSRNTSFLNKKPILKKRSVSEVMLQKSISTSSLIKQAAAAVQAQRRDRPQLGRAISDYTASSIPTHPVSTADFTQTFPSSSSSGLISPDPNGRRHIRFDNKVEQCIAVDFERSEPAEEYGSAWSKDQEGSSDEEPVMMKTKLRKRSCPPGNRRNSFGQDGKGIAKLPCTTLKIQTEDADSPGHSPQQFSGSWRFGKMNSSPSQETLRPARNSANFLLDEDDDDADMSWEPSGAFGNLRRDSVAATHARAPGMSLIADSDGEASSGLRRTPSGMFMPFEDGDEDTLATTGILGKMVDTVNTARDIAHVIWNVGWRS